MRNDELAKTWIELQSLTRETSAAEERMWASDEMIDLAMMSPQECWAYILEILSLTDDEWVLTNLGAGPIESMLAHNPKISIELIENEYAKNRKLQYAMRNVWQNLMPDEVWERVKVLP